jgi:signal transduction histidine kinase
MDTMLKKLHGRQIYTLQQLRVAAVLFVTYFVAYGLTVTFAAPSAALYPTAALAIVAVFFSLPRIWPFILLAGVVSGLAFEVPTLHMATVAVSDTLVGVLGGSLLLRANVDPVFRKYSDMFSVIGTIVLVSLIFPTLDAFSRIVTGTPFASLYWGRHYAGLVFSLLILVPLMLRWLAKPAFNRSRGEAIETILIFLLLIIINTALFVFGISNVFGVYLLYLLLFPLFWISLRLRPRFITLALFVTSLFAIWNAVVPTAPDLFAFQLFTIETFLITLSIIFLVIVALEEDRRLNTNLMRSQLSMLENAVTRISSESQAKNDFIAILAHELRNPLAPVVSAIDLLKITGNRDAEELETLDMMENRMKTVKRLLDDLLDVSRISEGKVTIKSERVRLDTVIKRAVLSTEHHVRERHQELTLKGMTTNAKPLYVIGDTVRLEQVFSNLITNASKYSDPGDSITITLKKLGTDAQISVKDTGIGIPAESLRHIFTPFHQVGSGARTQKGLGIGLALVQSFVQVHGGSITVTSEGKGKGSEFIVTLPLLHEDNDTTIAKSK